MTRVKPARVRYYFDADLRGLGQVLARLRPDVTYPGDPGGEVYKRQRPACPIATSDVKDRECIVWIHFGELRHGVHGVSAVRMVPRIGESGPVIEVEDKDGVKTILTLGDPEAYRLPPAQNRPG